MHYGPAAIPVFVGAKFLLEGFGVHLPIIASLIPVAAILAISIVASLMATRGGGAGKNGQTGRGPEDRGRLSGRGGARLGFCP